MREDVRKVFEEAVFPIVDNMDSEEPTPLEETQHFALTVHLAAVQRAINCAHVYGATRRRDIENLRWEKGAVLEENLRPNLDESEQQYFHKYCNLVAEYMGGEGLDITGDLSQPPVHYRVDVRANEDIYIMTSQGPVNLKKGSVAYLPREEIEPYVREGKMEIIRHT
ncbi:Psf1 family protein [Acanthamoeba castellanii str. Neff]|uniref:DNA replication complex GINS protein PSF1 n=1 Tax=Acanthamoeba castellanii (strain ATCC 30010 / Neff) TaxID=1257118 RepID=L8HLA2_ACACF|nr:Psf1 family protein [Acanthamoeba castellanii str. Neff]ELR25146.1 Psf1 family protein [Acanthamoeba castellanii str. Neff]